MLSSIAASGNRDCAYEYSSLCLHSSVRRLLAAATAALMQLVRSRNFWKHANGFKGTARDSLGDSNRSPCPRQSDDLQGRIPSPALDCSSSHKRGITHPPHFTTSNHPFGSELRPPWTEPSHRALQDCRIGLRHWEVEQAGPGGSQHRFYRRRSPLTLLLDAAPMMQRRNL